MNLPLTIGAPLIHLCRSCIEEAETEIIDIADSGPRHLEWTHGMRFWIGLIDVVSIVLPGLLQRA